MTGNTHMPNLISSYLQFLAYFPETKCDDDAGPIGDPSQLSDTKLLQL